MFLQSIPLVCAACFGGPRVSLEGMVCDNCHQEKPDTVVRIDPYAKEIHDEEVEMALCDQCEEDRRDDI